MNYPGWTRTHHVSDTRFNITVLAFIAIVMLIFAYISEGFLLKFVTIAGFVLALVFMIFIILEWSSRESVPPWYHRNYSLNYQTLCGLVEGLLVDNEMTFQEEISEEYRYTPSKRYRVSSGQWDGISIDIKVPKDTAIERSSIGLRPEDVPEERVHDLIQELDRAVAAQHGV